MSGVSRDVDLNVHDLTLTGDTISSGDAQFVNLVTTGLFGVTGQSTFIDTVNITKATNQLTLGATAHQTIISSTVPAAASVTYTIPDIGHASNFSFASNYIVAVTNTDLPLSATQNGATILVPQATVANKTITLPATAAGLNFKFIKTAVGDATHTWTISPSPGGAVFNGHLIGPAGPMTLIQATGQSSIVFGSAAANSVIGDSLSLYCNGTIWLYEGISGGTAMGITTA